MRNEAGDALKEPVMELDHESYKGVKILVLYHESNGNSLKGVENGFGSERRWW